MSTLKNFFSTLFENKKHLITAGGFVVFGIIVSIIKLLLFGIPGVVFAAFGLGPFIAFGIFALFIRSRWVIICSGAIISLISLTIFIYTLYGLLILQGNAAPLMFILTPLPETIIAIVILISLFLSDLIYKKTRKTA